MIRERGRDLETGVTAEIGGSMRESEESTVVRVILQGVVIKRSPKPSKNQSRFQSQKKKLPINKLSLRNRRVRFCHQGQEACTFLLSR